MAGASASGEPLREVHQVGRVGKVVETERDRTRLDGDREHDLSRLLDVEDLHEPQILFRFSELPDPVEQGVQGDAVLLCELALPKPALLELLDEGLALINASPRTHL